MVGPIQKSDISISDQAEIITKDIEKKIKDFYGRKITIQKNDFDQVTQNVFLLGLQKYTLDMYDQYSKFIAAYENGGGVVEKGVKEQYNAIVGKKQIDINATLEGIQDKSTHVFGSGVKDAEIINKLNASAVGDAVVWPSKKDKESLNVIIKISSEEYDMASLFGLKTIKLSEDLKSEIEKLKNEVKGRGETKIEVKQTDVKAVLDKIKERFSGSVSVFMSSYKESKADIIKQLNNCAVGDLVIWLGKDPQHVKVIKKEQDQIYDESSFFDAKTRELNGLEKKIEKELKQKPIKFQTGTKIDRGQDHKDYKMQLYLIKNFVELINSKSNLHKGLIPGITDIFKGMINGLVEQISLSEVKSKQEIPKILKDSIVKSGYTQSVENLSNIELLYILYRQTLKNSLGKNIYDANKGILIDIKSEDDRALLAGIERFLSRL